VRRSDGKGWIRRPDEYGRLVVGSKRLGRDRAEDTTLSVTVGRPRGLHMGPVILAQGAMVKHRVEIGENDRAAHEERSQKCRAEPSQERSSHKRNDNPKLWRIVHPGCILNVYTGDDANASAHIQVGQ
jgi:hypothetical protein